MKTKSTSQRGAQGKHTAGNEPSVHQVRELFHAKAVFKLQVNGYRQLTEEAKHYLCELLMDVTLCKVPARDGKSMLFYLSKEVRL